MGTKGNPGVGSPISRQGGRKGGKGSRGLSDTATTQAHFPRPAANIQAQAQKGNAGTSRSPLSGLGGGRRSSAPKPTRGGGAQTGGGGTTTS